MTKFAVHTDQLSRSFQSLKAVDELSLSVPEGSIFGFLGPNGAGKTTTIRMLLGLIRPDTGSIHLNGYDLKSARCEALAGVGAIVENPALLPNLTGRETLDISRILLDQPASRIDELLDLMDLSNAANKRVGNYSLGMRQRLALARALLGNPRLLILDEPTNGLDPAGIASMRQLIKSLPDRFGATVMLSSHLLSEIEQTATHCALIHNGRLIFQDHLSVLQNKAAPSVHIHVNNPDHVRTVFEGMRLHPEQQDHVFMLEGFVSRKERAELISVLSSQNAEIDQVIVQRPNLEKLFLDLTSNLGERA